jgi:predicted acyl esterase
MEEVNRTLLCRLDPKGLKVQFLKQIDQEVQTMNKDWERLVSKPAYKVKCEENVSISMRDGVRLFADIYRPDAEGKFPALVSMSPYGKEMQRLIVPKGMADVERTIWRGVGGIEAGNTEYFVSRGYIHVIVDVRGSATSEGKFGGGRDGEDAYDAIEWAGEQPWCNGNVGMLGMSYFAALSLKAAALNPPHLKAIAPVEAMTDRYRHGAYHGGIMHYGFWLHVHRLFLVHTVEEQKEFTRDQLAQRIEDLKKNEDIRGYPFLYMLTIMPQKDPFLLGLLLHPYDGPYWWQQGCDTDLDKINIPSYMMCRWNAWGLHLPGAFRAYEQINAPRKLRLYTTPSPVTGPDRPWSGQHDIILRWYDHWLKGIDTGIMDEPPIQIFVQGINEWRYENEWPLARTKWTKFYLRSNGVLQETPPIPGEFPDAFTNKPWLKVGEEVPCVKYATAPLTGDVELTGPFALHFHASLSTEDTNWMVCINDVDEDGVERVMTRGWLKASHRELDETKSKRYQPYHPHTGSLPIEPGKIFEYAIDLRETSNVFRVGHRIQLVIKGQDSTWDEGGGLYFHLNNMKETKHFVYHSDEYPSYLLLPIIPK